MFRSKTIKSWIAKLNEVDDGVQKIIEKNDNMVKCHVTKFYISKADAVKIDIYTDEQKMRNVNGSFAMYAADGYELKKTGCRYYHPEHAPKGVDHIIVDRNGKETEFKRQKRCIGGVDLAEGSAPQGYLMYDDGSYEKIETQKPKKKKTKKRKRTNQGKVLKPTDGRLKKNRNKKKK